MIDMNHPIWVDIWERSNPNSPRYASHLDQLFEARLQMADMYEALAICRNLLDAFIGPDDALGQAHLQKANTALAKADGQLVEREGGQ